MSFYNPDKHHRRSIRLKGYDYGQEGLYFITLCCQDRANLFGKIEQGKLLLNEFGKIASEQWANTPNIRPNVSLGAYIIMPNHIHGILEITHKKSKASDVGKFKSPSQTVGAMIRGYKIATIKKIKEKIKSKSDSKGKGELQFAPTEAPTLPTEKVIELDYKIWQRNYYEHIIRNETSYQTISNYIINNPQKWEDDKFFN
jgi:REP element-mobilizing transposase RayT